MEECGSVYEGDDILPWDDIQFIYFLLGVIQFATEIWGMMDKEMLQHGQTIIISD